ncbi:hypothetical protein PFICI_05300 [Pestalotiopsis fici W106-1]|uniref:Uncharacterized protein n=1 Tax=Pestalotiopsis fici (strain W106-1 / CGMCC3.15140) TaxID=1229662 RepID=W3XBM0_PESFW|nr:uncharacterized protein PFICI_05300 [Pestalotiopsis fici W106-1]ETS83424.1 hypothetical protein PFICI_05300 [Pestalotiopsis fici W106-1]
MLSVRLIPNGCHSQQVTFQRAQFQQRAPPRTEACSMRNPEMEGFVREEDTAGSEPHFSLDGFDGLGEVLSQVIPAHVDGNYEDEIRKRYVALRNEVLLRRVAPPTPSPTISQVEEPIVTQPELNLSHDFVCSALMAKRNVGVIGDHRRPTNHEAAGEEDDDNIDSDEDEILPFRPSHFAARRLARTQTPPKLSIADLLVDSTPDFDEDKVSTFGTTANWIKSQRGEDDISLPFMPLSLRLV